MDHQACSQHFALCILCSLPQQPEGMVLFLAQGFCIIMSPESRALLCASHASQNDLRCSSSLQIRKPILKRISSGKAQSAQ